jgi:hypothetical protein
MTKYRCPACGERLNDDGLLTYYCQYCDAVFDIEELTIDDEDSSFTQEYDEFTDADPGL